MRNRLDAAFEQASEERRAALIPYLTAGFPDPDRFVDLAAAILGAGADALEIGIPFSDPLLDGPAIQRSQQAALDAGITPSDCLRFAAQINRRTAKPLLFMGAYNPILAYGLERFARGAADSGISGLIVPDLPLEEQGDLRTECERHELHFIEMAAPTSTPERLAQTAAVASGFVYGVSVAGVTGARASVRDTAAPLVERIRTVTRVPVAVGFGIAGPDQAREVAAFADGVIVGSALITLLADTPREQRLPAATAFISDLRDALQRPSACPA